MHAYYPKESLDRHCHTLALATHAVSISVPWGRIAGKSCGDESSSRKILCLHGWMDNAGSFDRLVPLLKISPSHIVSIDLPDHGLSSHRPPGTNQIFANYLVDVRRVVQGLKWEKFSFLCHSMGSGVGAMYGSVMPEQVERMVLIEGGIAMPRQEDDFVASTHKVLLNLFENEGKKNRVYESEEDILKRILEGNADLTETAAKTLAVRGTRKSKAGTYEFTRNMSLKQPSLISYTPAVVRKFTKNISQPTLIIRAKDTYVSSLTEEVLVAVNNPQISLQAVDGNHHVHINQPELVAGLVSEFLSKERAAY